MSDKNTGFKRYNKDPALLDQWIRGCAEKNTDALSCLYESVSSAVFAYALSVLKNRQDAEDVLHDCFINIFSAAPGYVSSGKPMAWIMTIARNLCMNTLKQRGKTAEIQDSSFEKNLADCFSVSPEDRLLLISCMEKLSGDERRILVLHAVSGFRHREIAEFLGLPLATVLSKYSRAVKKLRTILEKEISP